MNIPLVSIIINNYNYGSYVGQSIDSALNQKYPHVEVIVVDDGSTDDSREVISAYGSRIKTIFKQNGGQASAMNSGFLECRGSIICFLDSDDVFLPHKIDAVVKAFETDSSIGWFFHPLYVVDDSFLEKNHQDHLADYTESHYFKLIDFRQEIRSGKLPNFVPSTSGLCFSYSVIDRIFPLPESENVSISDLYIKYVALALEKGCVSSQSLAIQRVHQNNVYTGKNDTNKHKTFAKINILTAYHMLANFPEIKKTSNKLFGKGLGSYLLVKNSIGLSYTDSISRYFKSIVLTEKIQIALHAFYTYLKLRIRVF